MGISLQFDLFASYAFLVAQKLYRRRTGVEPMLRRMDFSLEDGYYRLDVAFGMSRHLWTVSVWIVMDGLWPKVGHAVIFPPDWASENNSELVTFELTCEQSVMDVSCKEWVSYPIGFPLEDLPENLREIAPIFSVQSRPDS